jgi:glyceraldehyde-3-phosphate dehydrogenase/erythrose-4-phosphate dehydrogenase
MAKVAINGLGRIGRAALKIVLDTPELEFVAANGIALPENLAYLLKYDTVYGRYEKPVASDEEGLIIAGKKYPLLREKTPPGCLGVSWASISCWNAAASSLSGKTWPSISRPGRRT